MHKVFIRLVIGGQQSGMSFAVKNIHGIPVHKAMRTVYGPVTPRYIPDVIIIAGQPDDMLFIKLPDVIAQGLRRIMQPINRNKQDARMIRVSPQFLQDGSQMLHDDRALCTAAAETEIQQNDIAAVIPGRCRSSVIAGECEL